ncbi:MAG: Por secretion system protein [Bacteroidaceae bacterium]|nr:Por secretion system protein [Bacteroidaceae bacterium]
MMKRTILHSAFCFLLSTALSINTFANDGKWNIYLSYNGTPQDIESADKKIYVQANNGLYSYNRNDGSIETYNKLNLLSDIDVQYIAWAKAVKKLVVIYNNGNIDLICNNATETENISDYFNKFTTDDKTINGLYVKDNILLLATNFGIVKIDIRKAEIMETYNLAQKFQKAGMDDKFIYGLSNNTLYKGTRTKNLIDPNSWTKEEWKGQFDFRTVNDEINAEDKAIVENIKMDDSPKNNQISSLLFDNGRLIVTAGGLREGVDKASNYIKPAICEYSRKSGWKHYDEIVSAVQVRGNRDFYQIAVNPADHNNVFAGTWGNGIFEFYNGKLIGNYTAATHDIIKSAVEGSNDYVVTTALCFTKPNQLYIYNGMSENAILNYDCTTKSFTATSPDEVMQLEGRTKSCSKIYRMMADSRGTIWMGTYDPTYMALFSYNPQTNKVNTYNTFTNQDGSAISVPVHIEDVAEDRLGNIWVATDVGPILLNQQLIDNPQQGFYQVKVPRNDGTNFADYLMSGIPLTCIAIDEADNKWFGTLGNGVYCISADNMEQIYHFTTANSALLCDDIKDIKIDNETGEVFIATDKGLCSYLSGITKSNEEMSNDNVWAFPNPVTPDYDGEITICGLSFASKITITTASGAFVTEGISSGGTFKWDGRDRTGKRVASGVYMVHSATSEGEKGVVCKVAIIN